MSSIPRVVITNDDGPPSEKESPFILSFVKALDDRLSWPAHVVIPASQKSWISSAYMIKETIPVSRYTPPPEFATSASERWVLLGGTPSTCSNIALHNLYPGQVDLVLSGPNYGRNTSSAFAMSSGTVGAAMTASMASVPAIALSYGVFDRPVPPAVLAKANEIACTVISKLWHDVLKDGKERPVDVYNVNVPLVPEILEQDSNAPKVAWTTLANRKYGRIFLPEGEAEAHSQAEQDAKRAGPAAVPLHSPEVGKEQKLRLPSKIPAAFAFKPDLSPLTNPDTATLEPGTDLWALHQGYTSVSPLKATFAQGEQSSRIATLDTPVKGMWKL